MTNETPMSAYLKDIMSERVITMEELQKKLGYRRLFNIECWLRRSGAPSARDARTNSQAR